MEHTCSDSKILNELLHYVPVPKSQDSKPDLAPSAVNASAEPTPIFIHVPPVLLPFTVPLPQFQAQYSHYEMLVVGACIFATACPSTPATQIDPSTDNTTTLTPHLLIVQRAAKESMGYYWEVPGGGVDDTDPTIIHALAREVFEETGLKLTRVVSLLAVQEFRGRRGVYCKWTFEIEVAEIPVRPAVPEPSKDGVKESQRVPTPADIHPPNAPPEAVVDLKDIPVKLDPAEHQNYAWITLEEAKATPPVFFTTKDQKVLVFDAFGAHKSMGFYEWQDMSLEDAKKSLAENPAYLQHMAAGE